MCYRHDRALGSPPSSNAPIQRRQVVVLHHRDGPGRLRQTTAERDIALAHLAAQPLPGARKTRVGAPGDHDLLVAQRHQGIDARSAASGNVGSSERDSDLQERDAEERDRVVSPDTEEQAR